MISLRSRAGENWNALSLRIWSTSSLRASRWRAPAIGRDRVVGLVGPLEVAVDRLAADVFGRQVRPVAELADAGHERASRSRAHESPSLTTFWSRSLSISPAIAIRILP